MAGNIEFLKNSLVMRQTDGVFPIGTDSLFLSDFIKPKPRSRILDMGIGSGIISLLISTKAPDLKITGIDINPAAVSLAHENVSANFLEGQISVCELNILNASKHFGHGVFDIAATNPPYFSQGSGLSSRQSHARSARHEAAVSLESIVSETAKVLKYGGEFYIVYPADKLALLIQLLTASALIPKRLRFFCPRPGAGAVLFAMMAKKGASHSVKVEPTLYQFDSEGRETEDYKNLSCLRKGDAT